MREFCLKFLTQYRAWSTGGAFGRKQGAFVIPPLFALSFLVLVAGCGEDAADKAQVADSIDGPSPTLQAQAVDATKPVGEARTQAESTLAPGGPGPTSATVETPVAPALPTAIPELAPTPTAPAVANLGLYQPGSFGLDISFPQCGSALPANATFGIVGVSNGLAYTTNPCLREQFEWADQLAFRPAFYMNTSNSGAINVNWGLPGPKPCIDPDADDDLGCSYNFGWNGAAQAMATALSISSSAASYSWWLDVETENSWNGTSEANSAAIQGYFDFLKSSGVSVVGVYSNRTQWALITDGYTLPGAPNWVAGAGSPEEAVGFCEAGFSGGPVWLVQFGFSGFHGDYACPNAGS